MTNLLLMLGIFVLSFGVGYVLNGYFECARIDLTILYRGLS